MPPERKEQSNERVRLLGSFSWATISETGKFHTRVLRRESLVLFRAPPVEHIEEVFPSSILQTTLETNRPFKVPGRL